MRAAAIAKLFAISSAQGAALWALLLGGLATLPVLVSADVIWAISMLLLAWQPEATLAFVYAAIPEEMSKILVLTVYLKCLGYRTTALHPADAPSGTLPSQGSGESLRLSPLLIGFLLGLGFAVVELWIYFMARLPVTLAEMAAAAGPLGLAPDPALVLGVMALRVFTALPLHAGVTALAAVYWTEAAPVRAVLIPILLHGFYDLAILQAARGGGLGPLLLAYAVLALLAAWVMVFHAWLRPLTALSPSPAQAAARPSPL